MDNSLVRYCRQVIVALAMSWSLSTYASGVSLYLPVQTSPEFELQIERLVSITQMPVLTRPYHIDTVKRYLAQIENDYPTLHYRISTYLQRYSAKQGITQYAAEIAISNRDDQVLPNQRGRTSSSNGMLQLSGYLKYNDNLQFSLGNTLRHEGGFIPQMSFVTFGNEYIQADIGYREHWYSPTQESAMLMSTQAETPLTLTLSNATPLTDWNIRYDFFVGKLDSHDQIRYGDEFYKGKPGIAGTHISFQPFSWWTFGGNRTFQFGGGKRSVSFSDFWHAFWDPSSADNCGSPGLPNCDKDQEVGNQLASVSSKFDFVLWDMPVTLLWEYGGEDTKDHGYELGNIAQSYSLFLPFLTEDSSLYMEYQDFHMGWYVHHLYKEGYTNKGHVMGHWWGDVKDQNDQTAATMITVRYNLDFWSSNHLSLTYRTVDNEGGYRREYERTQELQMRVTTTYEKALVGAELYVGTNVNDDNFYRLGLFYRW